MLTSRRYILASYSVEECVASPLRHPHSHSRPRSNTATNTHINRAITNGIESGDLSGTLTSHIKVKGSASAGGKEVRLAACPQGCDQN